MQEINSLIKDNIKNKKDIVELLDSDIQLHGRIDNIINGVAQDSEVIDARNSVTKNKLFTTLDTRLEETELDVKTITNKFNLAHYDEVLGEYVNLDKFWDALRNGKKYTVEFNQYSVSPSPLGTKKDDNEGLICEPSTNTVKGRNDYENIGLFMTIDVNAYIDENDDYHVTAIKGDGRFKSDGTNGDVYVMAMTGYTKYYSDNLKWSMSYSDTMHPGYEIIHEAVKVDGTIRPYLIHAKYVAGKNPKDGKLASISGVNAEYNNMSHDGQIDQFKLKGIQYSGKTTHDDYYLSLMLWLKYATTNQESIIKGCISYYLQYTNVVAETQVRRVIIPTTQANNLLVGSCVSIGDYQGGTKTDDRSNALNYNKANRVKIISIVDLGDGNSEIIVDSLVNFDTTLTTTITTYPWKSGACDNVLGVDGSPISNSSGKEPCMINGIEFMVGGYEIIQNLIIYNDNTNPEKYEIKVYVNYDCKTYSKGTVTEAYDLLNYRLAQTNQSWQYITKIGIESNNPSVIIPIEVGGSSTTGFADGLYTNTPTTGYREWLSLGILGSGSICGLRCLSGDNDLGDAYWSILGRLSATGRSRRRVI